MRKATIHLAHRRTAGFTMVELMVTLSIVGVLLGIVAPNMRDYMRNQRLYVFATDLVHALQLARSESLKQQLPAPQSVILCASDNPDNATPTCSYGSFNGWIVFRDTNSNWQYDGGEIIVQRHNIADASVRVRTDNSGIVSYRATGFASLATVPGITPTNNIVLCDQRGTSVVHAGSLFSFGRVVLIMPTGRARTTNAYADVTAAVATIGQSC